MKGHTVPWAFLPKEFQAILAVTMIVFVVIKTYKNLQLAQRWWPWISAAAAVLLTPVLVRWLGFGPSGILAGSMAAELQSLATSWSGLTPVVSALQSISTKGMGLKTAAVIFTAGWTFGRTLLVSGHRKMVEEGWIVEDRPQLDGNRDASQPLEQGEQNPAHPHRE